MNKKGIIVFSMFSIFVFSVAGQGTHTFNLDLKIGAMYGTAYEIIYNNSANSQYNSELQWNIKPLWFTGLSVEYVPKEPYKKNNIYGAIELIIGLPIETGLMEDRDWLTPTTTPGSLTLFSSHENKTNAAILANFECGLSLPLTNNILMKVYLGFSYMYYKFEAWDGYIQYGSNNHQPNEANPYTPWDSSWTKVQMYGLGIDYTQHFFIVKPGIEFIWEIKSFRLNIGISVSPLIACITEDNHYQRNPSFLLNSNLSGGLFIEPKMRFLYMFFDNFGVGVSFSYRYIEGLRGDIEQSEYLTTGTVTKKFANISGVAYSAFTAEITVRVTF
ncbi:MAG: omptin family outer membrane protease [Treponema sp.]|jgi:outer membrane protease|nr:omptin family outer membrane protease [Treponema sp.]